MLSVGTNLKRGRNFNANQGVPKKRFSGKSDNCGRTGHMKRDCFRPGGGAHDPSRWRAEPSRFEGYKQTTLDNNDNNEYKNKYLIAYTVELHAVEAYTTSVRENEDWVVDSGATFCLTPNKNDFKEIDEKYKKQDKNWKW